MIQIIKTFKIIQALAKTLRVLIDNSTNDIHFMLENYIQKHSTYIMCTIMIAICIKYYC